jgi:hypothetical protein
MRHIVVQDVTHLLARAVTSLSVELPAFPGGSGKAEGFADEEWVKHRQAATCRCHPRVDEVLRETRTYSV